jgi:hypothetical protein
MARDNAVEYSIDQAQRMFGKGVEVIGRAAGIESIFNYGQEIVKQQDEDIRLGQYKPQYTVGLREAYNQGGIDDGIGWLLEKTGENIASSGVALVGGLASALTAPFSVPVAALIGGATLVGSGIMGTGETAEEMEQKTGDYNEAVALGAGTIIGILDRFGAGKVIPKDELLTMTGKQLIKALGAEGKTDAAKEIGKRIGKSIAFEGATEGAQEGVVMGATGITGGEYTGLEIADRILEGTLLGSTMGGGTTTGIEALRQGPGVVNQIQDIMSGPGPGGLTPQMAVAGAQLSPDRAQMSLIPEVPKTSAEILMSEKSGDETGGGAPVDPIMTEDPDKLTRDPDDNIAMTDDGRHFSRLAIRLQQLPFDAEGLTGRQVLQELGVVGEQDNKMPKGDKRRDYIGSITEVRNIDTGIPRVKTTMKQGLSKEDKDRFIAAKKAGEVPPADLIETVPVLDSEGNPATIKGPSPTFTFSKQDGTVASNKGGELYQSGLEDFLYKNLDNKFSKEELLNEYKDYRPQLKTRLLLSSRGERAHGTYSSNSLEYLQRIPQLVEGFTSAPNTPDRKYDTVYDDFGIVQFTPNQKTVLGRTRFSFPTKKDDDKFQQKQSDAQARADQGVKLENQDSNYDPSQEEIDAWLLKNEPSTVKELDSLAQQLGYNDPFGQLLDRKSTGVPFHKYYETDSVMDAADSTGNVGIDPSKGEPTAQAHTRGEIVVDNETNEVLAQASETQSDNQRQYERELDSLLPEPGAWSFDKAPRRHILTPSDMRTLDEAKGATIDAPPEDSLLTYEQEKTELKEEYAASKDMTEMEQTKYDGHVKAEQDLRDLEFVQDKIEGLEEQEHEFTKEFLPKFFKTIDDKLKFNIETNNIEEENFVRNGAPAVEASSISRDAKDAYYRASERRKEAYNQAEHLRFIRNLKDEFYDYGATGGDISKYREMLLRRKALNEAIKSIVKDQPMMRTGKQKKFNPVYTFLDGVPSFMPGYAENKLLRESGGLHGEDPIHVYYGQELLVNPQDEPSRLDEPVFGSLPHPLLLSNHMMQGDDTVLIPKATHNGKFYPTDDFKRNDFESVIDFLISDVRKDGFDDPKTKTTIAQIVQSKDFQDTNEAEGTTWTRRKKILQMPPAEKDAAFANHTQNIDSFVLTALSRGIKPSEIYRMVKNIITNEVFNRQAANIIARKTASEVRRKHKNELDQINLSERGFEDSSGEFTENAKIIRDMLSNKAKNTAMLANRQLMNKFQKELGFVPVFAPEVINRGTGDFTDMAGPTAEPFTNRKDRLDNIRKQVANAFTFKLINPTELNLPSDVVSFSAISNFNPNIYEQIAAQQTLQKAYDGPQLQAVKKDIIDSAIFLDALKRKEKTDKEAFESFDPDGKELARRLSLLSGDIGNADPSQIKDLIEAINSGKIVFRTPAFGESSSADRFSYRNLIHHAMNEMPNPLTGKKGLDGIIIPHRKDMFEVPGGRGGNINTFGLNKYEAIPKKVLEEIAKEMGATLVKDYPMKYKGKSGRVYPSKRPVTKLIFNKDAKGKAIAQYKKGGLFEKFRKVS